MPCYHPVDAWRPVAGGPLLFAERGDCRPIRISCGQCIGCRLERSRVWAMRCVHEASQHESACFVTLTYNDNFLPHNGSLCYPHFQRFMKRLRKKLGKVRFYMCGEYGDLTKRPHYHAILFGASFPDRELLFKSSSGSDVFRSATLEALWPYGFCSLGDVTFESAAYVARYVLKKASGSQEVARRYMRVDGDSGEVFEVVPEFSHMSLKPGIGSGWFAKFGEEVITHKGVMFHGVRAGMPKYYRRMLRESDPLAADFFDEDRLQSMMEHHEFEWNNSVERLAVREHVAAAALSFKKRSLE